MTGGPFDNASATSLPPATAVTLSSVPDKEHPARTAGRYVRAARIAISNELERRSAEAEQRVAQAPEPAREPAAEAPPPRAAPPTTAPPRTRRTARPAPPPKPFVDRLVYYGFLLSLLAAGLVPLQLQTLASGSVRLGYLLGIGSVLILVAVPILTDWQQSKERLTARIFKKIWGLDAPVSRSGRLMRKIGKDVMTMVGIAWLALGLYEILRAFVNP